MAPKQPRRSGCGNTCPSTGCLTFDHLIAEKTAMDTVTISPKYKIVIPKSVRSALRLSPGQKVQVIPYDNRIELIPVRPA